MPEMKWSKSESIGKLVEALAKAQSKFDRVLKDSDNPFYKSKYADLATVISATQPHMATEGLTVIQMPHAEFGSEDAKLLTLTTMIAHSSGEWIASDLTLPAMMKDRFDAQSTGSAITYARRYAWSAMTGVAQEDDDGQKATGMGTKQEAQAVAVSKLKGKPGSESVELVQWKDGTLAIRGNGLAILRASLTDEQKAQFTFKLDADTRGYTIPESQGNLFASMCDKYSVKCTWVD